MRKDVSLKSRVLAMLLFLVSYFCVGYNAYAQSGGSEIVITGVVLEEGTNEPLPGVQVWIKDSSYGAITDVNGRYTLKFKGKNGVICVSYLGYETIEQSIGSGKSQTINFKMQEAC
jgi:hypothetical protein